MELDYIIVGKIRLHAYILALNKFKIVVFRGGNLFDLPISLSHFSLLEPRRMQIVNSKPLVYTK